MNGDSGMIGVDIMTTPENASMARKKAEKPKMTAAEPKPIRLALPPDLHTQFRVEAAKQNKNMATLARELVEAYLARQAKGGAK